MIFLQVMHILDDAFYTLVISFIYHLSCFMFFVLRWAQSHKYTVPQMQIALECMHERRSGAAMRIVMGLALGRKPGPETLCFFG